MTNQGENTKRIVKNTIVLYIRMFLVMFISLYSSRIVLQALGVSKITSPYNYWTSSFVYSWEDHSRVYSVSFQYNTFSQGLKTNECLLMVIREFN